MANDNTNNNIPPIADESGVVKVWQFKQNADGSLVPAASGGMASAVDIFDSNGNALNSNGSGALEVAVVSGGGSNASVGTNGAVAPTSSTQVGGSDGTDLQPLQVDASKNLKTIVNAPLPAGTNVIGHVITDSGSVTAATLSAETTKVIGTVRNADGAGNLWTSNSTTYTAKFAQDSNILGTLGTAFTTPGFVDIKGADGNVFVRQATAANLNATVVGTLTNNNAAPAATNIGALTTVANAISPSWSEGNQVLHSTDLNGSQRVMSGNIPEVTAAWTSATAGNTTLSLTILGYSAIVVTLNQGTTITGGVVTFEVSDTSAGTNWYPILVSNSGVSSGTLGSTFTLVASTNSSFSIPVAGWAAFRVRLSTAISGTATVNVGIQAANFPVQLNTSNITSGTIVNTRSNNAIAALADNQSSTTFFPSSTNVNDPLSAGTWGYGGAFSGAADAARQGWSKRRTPTVVKTVQATASGNTAVWTPGSGNKFRILKVMVQLTDNASLASGAVLTISFQDATTAMPIAFDIFVPTTAVTTTAGAAFTQELDLGDFGILSAAANQAFNVNLSAALATGNVRVIALGTEE